jgi:hypothetical protein
MRKRPFDLARLAGDRDTIEVFSQFFSIKGPGEFFLIPLARLSLSVERLYQGLNNKPPDLAGAERLANDILGEICPGLVASKKSFGLITLEDKLEILDVFNRMGGELESPDSQPAANSLPAGRGQAASEPAEPTDWFEVIPRLQKFYGGSPRDWFNLEMKWLTAFSEQMESLKAEHILDMSKASLAGTWPTSDEQKSAIEDLINNLQTIVEGIENRQLSPVEVETELEKVGIGINRVEASPEQMAAIEKFFSM